MRGWLEEDHCEVLLAAGLASEAVDLVRRRIARGSLPAVQRAELELTQATAELADHDPAGAGDSAARARLMFRRQRRDSWTVRADLRPSPRSLRGRAPGWTTRRERHLGGSTASTGDAPEAIAIAWLLAGRSALAAGRTEAPDLLDGAFACRTGASDLVRATAWQARATRLDADGDRRGVLAACRRGLDALLAHQASLGSSELRALATRHGDEFASLALRHAATTGARVLLEWSERLRATALSQPSVHPPDDAGLARDLAALRGTRRRIDEAQSEGGVSTPRLDEERARLELAIRRRAHHLAGAGTTTAGDRFATAQLLEELDGKLLRRDGRRGRGVARAGGIAWAGAPPGAGWDRGGRTGNVLRPVRPSPDRSRSALGPGRRGPPAAGRRLLGDAVRAAGGRPRRGSPRLSG